MERLSTRNIFYFISLTAVFIISLATAIWTDIYTFLLVPFAILILLFGWLRMEIAFLLLLLALPFSFEYNFTPTLGTDIPDEGLMLMTALLFLGYWVYKPDTINNGISNHILFFLLLVHIAWILTTAITSTYPLLSFKFLLAKLWYLGAFVLAPILLFKDRRIIRYSALVLAIPILLLVLIALIRHAGDQFSFAAANDAVAPFFRNHVTYSSMVVCLLPLFFSFYALTKNSNTRFWIAFSIIILLVALFFSYARGAWLALVMGIIAYWFIRKKWLFQTYIIATILTIAALFWIKSEDRYLKYAHDYQTTIYHEDFGEHLVATYKLKDVSTAERFYRWIAGIRMVKDNWVSGFGPNTFYENYKPYGVPAFKTWVSDNKEHSTVHNYFLLVAIEQGIPGLLIFLMLLGAMFYYSQHLYHRIQDAFYKVAAITVGVVLVMISTVNFLSDLIETDKIGSLFFLCLSTLIMIDINTRNESKSSSHI